MTENKQLAVVDADPLAVVEDAPPPAVVEPTDPLSIIANASLIPGIDVDVIERLAKLKMEMDDRDAERQFNEAITAFQKWCPTVKKTREVNGKLHFKYAGMDDLMRHIRKGLADNDLSIAFNATPMDGGVNITCIVSHKAGHSRSTDYPCPTPDLRVSSTQSMGAALSYGRRYSLLAALNIVVSGEDDENHLTPDPVDNPKQKEGMPDVGTRAERATEKDVKTRWVLSYPGPDGESRGDTNRRFAGWYESAVLDGAPAEGPYDWNMAARQLDKEEAGR